MLCSQNNKGKCGFEPEFCCGIRKSIIIIILVTIFLDASFWIFDPYGWVIFLLGLIGKIIGSSGLYKNDSRLLLLFSIILKVEASLFVIGSVLLIIISIDLSDDGDYNDNDCDTNCNIKEIKIVSQVLLIIFVILFGIFSCMYTYFSNIIARMATKINTMQPQKINEENSPITSTICSMDNNKDNRNDISSDNDNDNDDIDSDIDNGNNNNTNNINLLLSQTPSIIDGKGKNN